MYSESLKDIAQDPISVLERASAENMNLQLARETDTASRLGIFGSPTFTIENELFWGDDRLDDAIKWYRFGHLRQT
jgi:2-hydroxychromene-2-carboxylate isomerase